MILRITDCYRSGISYLILSACVVGIMTSSFIDLEMKVQFPKVVKGRPRIVFSDHKLMPSPLKLLPLHVQNHGHL